MQQACSNQGAKGVEVLVATGSRYTPGIYGTSASVIRTNILNAISDGHFETAPMNKIGKTAA